MSDNDEFTRAINAEVRLLTSKAELTGYQTALIELGEIAIAANSQYARELFEQMRAKYNNFRKKILLEPKEPEHE